MQFAVFTRVKISRFAPAHSPPHARDPVMNVWGSVRWRSWPHTVNLTRVDEIPSHTLMECGRHTALMSVSRTSSTPRPLLGAEELDWLTAGPSLEGSRSTRQLCPRHCTPCGSEQHGRPPVVNSVSESIIADGPKILTSIMTSCPLTTDQLDATWIAKQNTGD